jgi:hypothetical protein
VTASSRIELTLGERMACPWLWIRMCSGMPTEDAAADADIASASEPFCKSNNRAARIFASASRARSSSCRRDRVSRQFVHAYLEYAGQQASLGSYGGFGPEVVPNQQRVERRSAGHVQRMKWVTVGVRAVQEGGGRTTHHNTLYSCNTSSFHALTKFSMRKS